MKWFMLLNVQMFFGKVLSGLDKVFLDVLLLQCRGFIKMNEEEAMFLRAVLVSFGTK